MDTFPSRLAAVIKNSGLSRAQFAKKCDVGTAAVGKWLSGKLMPKSSQLLSLARGADVPMEWLLTGDTRESPDSMNQRVEGVVTWLDKVGPLTEKKKASARIFWREMFEAQDESAAAKSAAGRPDVLALGDLLEYAAKEFDAKLRNLSEALGEIQAIPNPELDGRVSQGWEEMLRAWQRQNRRQQSLLAEIRAKHEPEIW